MSAPSTLTIDLNALVANFMRVRAQTGSGVAAGAAVKANAYGLGAVPVVEALDRAGCSIFFVAHPDEAQEIRPKTQKPIAVLNGLFQAPDFFAAHNIWPVLVTLEEIEAAAQYARTTQKPFPCLIQIDTGMNRLGLNIQEVATLARAPEKRTGLDVKFLMSHFIASENHACSRAENQYADFMRAVAQLGLDVPLSLSNSGGVFRDTRYHLGLVRPGACLYGINPVTGAPNIMQPVAHLAARILKIQDVKAGATIGYDATHTFARASRIATISFGYADGLLRSLSNRGSVLWHGHKCPIIGRVSMDLTGVDVTDLPPNLPTPQVGDCLEILNAQQTVDDLARDAGTNGYEILCALSRRAQRIYRA